MLTERKQNAKDKRSCPHCLARVGQLCWSEFLQERMVNEIHRERLHST